MTDQITVPRETWDAMREALKEAATSLETISRLAGRTHYVGDDGERVETYMGHHDQVRGYATSRASVARQALTAANAVSEPKSLFVDLIASHGPDFVDEMAAIDVEPEALITVESSLRFRLECEQQKSADLLDEVRELKGKLFKARQPQAQGEAVNIEALCARIKAADDASADMDYMLDSNDCIHVLRGTWKGPMLNDMPPHPQATEPASCHQTGVCVRSGLAAENHARLIECARRLVEHADFTLGGILSADSKAKDIPSKAVSQVKSRHLAALRDALPAAPEAKQ